MRPAIAIVVVDEASDLRIELQLRFRLVVKRQRLAFEAELLLEKCLDFFDLLALLGR